MYLADVLKAFVGTLDLVIPARFNRAPAAIEPLPFLIIC